MLRILIAGVVGGALVFCGGAFTHMALNLEGRAFLSFAKDEEVRQALKAQQLKPGVYRLPGLPEGWDKLKGEEHAKFVESWTAKYKEGPSGLLVIAPTGEEPMGPATLIGEFVTNLLAAVIAAWIVAGLAPGTSFVWRWAVVFSLGLFTWLSTSSSFEIWYRFPDEFIRDGLYCSMIEWGVAGLAIAAIIKTDLPTVEPPSGPTA